MIQDTYPAGPVLHLADPTICELRTALLIHAGARAVLTNDFVCRGFSYYEQAGRDFAFTQLA